MIDNITLVFLEAHLKVCFACHDVTMPNNFRASISYYPKDKTFTYGNKDIFIYFNSKDLRSYRKKIRLNHKLTRKMKEAK